MKINFWKIFTLILLALIISITVPFWLSINIFNIKVVHDIQNEFYKTFSRTIIFSVITSIVLTFIGFWGAVFLKNVPFFSGMGKNLGILIFPVMLGNLSIAFICKLLIGDSALFSFFVTEGISYKLLFLLLLQIWQYGLLFIYMFWLNFQSIPARWFDYMVANKFTFYQSVKDVYLPNSRNMILLLTCVGFVFTLFEESKVQYLFKVSPGTNSELITNWLTRNYQSYLLVNSQFAENIIFNSAVIIIFLSIVVIGLIYLLLNFISKIINNFEVYPSFSLKIKSAVIRHLSTIWASLLVAIVIIPMLFTFSKISFQLNSSLIQLGFPLIMTFIATFTAVLVAVIFGISARIGWQKVLNSFSNKSLLFFLVMFFLMLMPPIIVLLSGFKWMALIGYRSNLSIYMIWILGHTLITLPILGSFVLSNHFRVSNNELDYLKVFKLKSRELILQSFLKRFRAEYILLFIIGYSFIWNEAILNNLFSDYIPSFTSSLKMLITGRAADYSSAFGFLLVSIFLAITAVLIWRYIIEKAHKLVRE